MPTETSALKVCYCQCYKEYERNFSPQQWIWKATALIQNRNKEVTAFQTKPEFISACARTRHCTGQHLIETMFYIKTIIKKRLKKKAWFFLFPPVIITILSCTSDWPLTRGAGGGASVTGEGYSQWLARGRKTQLRLKMLKDGFNVRKCRVGCKPCCQKQRRGKRGGTVQQAHVHHYASYNADTNRNPSENIRHLLGVFHMGMFWAEHNVIAVNWLWAQRLSQLCLLLSTCYSLLNS